MNVYTGGVGMVMDEKMIAPWTVFPVKPKLVDVAFLKLVSNT